VKRRVAPINFRFGRRDWRPKAWRLFFGIVLFCVFIQWIPAMWCGRDAGVWWRGDAARQTELARSVGDWIGQPLGPEHFKTGDPVFDGEWLFGTYQMAVLGLGQIAMEHPEMRVECLRLMEDCEDRMLLARVREFDAKVWKQDPLEDLDGPFGHAGYLGYLNLALSFHRRLDPHFKHRELNDRISAALARNLEASPVLQVETYPQMAFPVDNTAVAVSLRLHDQADATNRFEKIYGRWLKAMRGGYVDRKTGLLVQRVDAFDGGRMDAPRGSGTLLSAYFLGLAGDPLGAELFRAAQVALWAPALGFGAALEYPGGEYYGGGDIDSGPLIFGRSISASGLMLACARQQGDEAAYRSLYRSVHLFGAPTARTGRRSFASGGPLGNAMMLALLTAHPVVGASESEVSR
jgi:hypothetical protein